MVNSASETQAGFFMTSLDSTLHIVHYSSSNRNHTVEEHLLQHCSFYCHDIF